MECNKISCADFYEMKLHPLEDEFIGVMDISKLPLSSSKVKCETVVILDRSGSMGQNVERIARNILPKFFEKLNYKSDEIIHLITFDSVIEYYNLTVGNFVDFEIQCQGCTYMKGAVEKLHELMGTFGKKKVDATRILTISDGEIGDQHETKEYSDELASFIKQFNFSINSQAVRFFTSSYGQPDTTALCCLLQLNNTSESNLLDISFQESFDDLAEKWADLFASDGLMSAVELQCDSPIFRKNPWDATFDNRMRLTKGKNVFWVKEIPKNLKISEHDVIVTVEPALTYEKFHSILNKKLEMIVDQMKILQIIQTRGKINKNLKLSEFLSFSS